MNIDYSVTQYHMLICQNNSLENTLLAKSLLNPTKKCNIYIFKIQKVYPIKTSKQTTKVVKCEALKGKTNIPLLLKHLNITIVNK